MRDGDRFWYSLQLNSQERELVESLRLADIIRLNTTIGGEINDDVFHVSGQNTASDSGNPPRDEPLRTDSPTTEPPRNEPPRNKPMNL